MGGTNIIDELVISRDEWRFRAERAEAERAAAREEAARYRRALEAVEWVEDEFDAECPWCYGIKPEEPPTALDASDDFGFATLLNHYNERVNRMGHKPDCPRQAALTPAGPVTELPPAGEEEP